MTASTDRVVPARTSGWRERALIGYFVVSALAVFGLWASYFLDGTAAAALFEPAEETGTLLGRTLGATLAGLVLSIAAAALRVGRHWAQGLALWGAGMVGYAALNTLGETLAAGSWGSVLLVLALVAALVVGCWSDDQPLLVVLSGVLAGSAAWLVWRAVHVGGGSLTTAITVTSLPGPHYLAEAAMALATVWGLSAWRRGRTWGIRLAMVGLGTYCYSTLNALDWAYINDGTVLPVLAVTLIAAIAGAVHLMNTKEISDAHRHRSIGLGGTPDGFGRRPVRGQG